MTYSDPQPAFDPVPNDSGPFALYGYYPLYDTELIAKGVGNGTAMPHRFDGVTYWMPNGIQQFHGDWPNYQFPYPPEIPSYSRYQEINFPPTDGLLKGYVHFEPANQTYYKWDGVKWDPTAHNANPDHHKWTRAEAEQILHPRDPDDYIQINGMKDNWIEFLP